MNLFKSLRVKPLRAKELWIRGVRRARDEYEDTQSDIEHARPFYRWVIYGFLIYLVCVTCLGLYWSSEPALLNISSVTLIRLLTTAKF
ncbi:MAG: hypothetical protein EOO68_04770 [Moraxellaceae bacterium]|nr:MAG: hypothetical protein EOO68_04770 [Moraxellaceae bacterium]